MTLDEAKEFLTHYICSCQYGTSPMDCDNPKCKFGMAIRILCDEEKTKGEWIGDTDYESCQGMYERYKCSECGYGIGWREHNQLMCQDEIPEGYREYYCPHCGADMREADNDD